MKFDIVINFDREKQDDVEIKADIPESKVREIVDRFFNMQDFAARRKWLTDNIDEINLSVL